MANDAVDENLIKSAHFKSNMHFIGAFLIPLYVLDISSRFIRTMHISYHSESTRRAALDAAQLLTMTTLQERVRERVSDVTSFAFTWNGTKQTAILMPSHRRMTSVPCARAGAFSSFHFHLLFAFQFVGHIHRSHTVTHMPLTASDSNEQLKDFHRFQLELPSKHNTQQMEFEWNSRKLYRVIVRHSFAQIIHVNDLFRRFCGRRFCIPRWLGNILQNHRRQFQRTGNLWIVRNTDVPETGTIYDVHRAEGFAAAENDNIWVNRIKH